MSWLCRSSSTPAQHFALCKLAERRDFLALCAVGLFSSSSFHVMIHVPLKRAQRKIVPAGQLESPLHDGVLQLVARGTA